MGIRIQVTDQNRRPIYEDGHPGVDLDDEMTERYHEIGDFLKDNCRTLTGKRYGAKDATDPLLFLQGNLTYLEKKAYEVEYTQLRSEVLLGPVTTSEAGENAVTVTYETVDFTGIGERHAAQAGDMPLADTASARTENQVAPGWIGYEYTNRELRIAATTGVPIPARKQEATLRAARRHLDKVALQGETVSNFVGLFTNSSVTATTRASGAVWDAAVPLTMLNDINTIISLINADTDGMHLPSHLALPAGPMGRLMIPDPSFPSRTALDFIKTNNMYTQITGKPFNIVAGGEYLATAGGSSSKRGVFFTPEDECMALHQPLPPRFASPVQGLLKVIVPCEYGYGGLNIRRLKTIRYMDGL
jgi:hypothetical protein